MAPKLPKINAPIINPDFNFLRPDYWFGQVDARPLGLFRILFGLQLLKDALYHIPLGPLFYSDEGIFSREVMAEFVRSNRFSLMDAIHAPWMATVFFLLWVVVLVNLIIGNRTRLMTILNFLFILSIHERNIYLLNGGDTMMRVISFWMIFLPLAKAYSLDALRQRRQTYLRTRNLADLRLPGSPVTGWAFALRIVQLQVAIVYIFATLTKIPTGVWLRGEALYYALQIDTLMLPTGHLLFDLSPPWLLSVLGWGALFIEGSWVLWVFLPFFQPALRRIGLVLGVMFHLGIGLTMTIPNFSIVMMLTYILFLDSALMDRIEAWWYAVRERITMGVPAGGGLPWLALASSNSERLSVTAGQTASAEPERFSVTTASGETLRGEAAIVHLAGVLPFSRLWRPLMRIPAFCRFVWGLGGDLPAADTDDPTTRTNGDPSLPWWVESATRGAGVALLTTLIVLVGWWNLANLELADDESVAPSVRGLPREVVQYTGLWQSWKLFAPFPSRVYGWVTVEGVFENEETFDLRTGQPTGEEYARWMFGPFTRWRKYEDRIRRDGSEEMLRAWASYYCRAYNNEIGLPEGQRLATMEIHYVWRRTPDPGQPMTDYESRRLWKHWCYPEYEY